MRFITLPALAAVSLSGCSSKVEPGPGPRTEEEAEAPTVEITEVTPQVVEDHEDLLVRQPFDMMDLSSPIGLGGGRASGRYLNTGRAVSGESYADFPESGFQVAARQPRSTFGIDVDSASWTNVRRTLRNSELPPAGAVRIEELVNAFLYDDPPPKGGDVFRLVTELGKCPWNTDHQLLRIGLRTRPIETARVPPCNLVFLLDVSGSMRHRLKLPLLQRAFDLLVDQLRPRDHIAVVTYASGTQVLLASARGDEKQRIRAALAGLTAGGGTNGQGGIQRAYEIARQHVLPEGVNRVILATDGDFNVGIRDGDELAEFIAGQREHDVFLTVLGLGTGNLKDDRLQALARHGNGTYAYLDSLAEARRVLVEQFGSTVMTVAKDVKVQVEFNPAHAAGYRLLGYEDRRLNARDFRDDGKDSGEIGAGHAVTMLFEIVPAGRSVPGIDAAADEVSAVTYGGEEGELLTVRLRYKPPLGDKGREESHPVPLPDALPAQPSNDFDFAAAVAAFGMLLRESPHARNFGWDDVLAMAKRARGQRPERQDFIEMVEKAAFLGDR